MTCQTLDGSDFFPNICAFGDAADRRGCAASGTGVAWGRGWGCQDPHQPNGPVWQLLCVSFLILAWHWLATVYLFLLLSSKERQSDAVNTEGKRGNPRGTRPGLNPGRRCFWNRVWGSFLGCPPPNPDKRFALDSSTLLVSRSNRLHSAWGFGSAVGDAVAHADLAPMFDLRTPSCRCWDGRYRSLPLSSFIYFNRWVVIKRKGFKTQELRKPARFQTHLLTTPTQSAGNPPNGFTCRLILLLLRRGGSPPLASRPANLSRGCAKGYVSATRSFLCPPLGERCLGFV